MSPGQVILFIIGSVVIIFAAYYTTYFLSSRHTKRIKMKGNRNIQLRDRFSVAKDKGFFLVEVSGKTYFVGMSNNSVTLLDTFDTAEFEDAVESTDDMPDGSFKKGFAGFTAAMKKSWQQLKEGKGALVRPPSGREDSVPAAKEEFEDIMSQTELKAEREEDSLDAVLKKVERRRTLNEQSDSPTGEDDEK